MARGDAPLDPEEVVMQVAMFPAMGYFIHPMTEDQRAERVRKWNDALGAIPGGFVLGAFDEWFEKGRRAPAPGEIRGAARDLADYAKTRITNLTPVEEREPAPTLECTPEEIERRRKFVEELSAEFPEIKRVRGDK